MVSCLFAQDGIDDRTHHVVTEGRGGRLDRQLQPLGQTVRVGAGDDVSGLLKTGLFEFTESLGACPRGGLHDDLGQAKGDALWEGQEHVAGDVAGQRKMDGRDGIIRLPQGGGGLGNRDGLEPFAGEARRGGATWTWPARRCRNRSRPRFARRWPDWGRSQWSRITLPPASASPGRGLPLHARSHFHHGVDVQDQGHRAVSSNGGAGDALHVAIVLGDGLDDHVLLPEQLVDNQADLAVLEADDDQGELVVFAGFGLQVGQRRPEDFLEGGHGDDPLADAYDLAALDALYLRATDGDDFGDGLQGNGIDALADPGHEGTEDGQGQRQLDGDAAALSRDRVDVDGPAELFDLADDDVHTHAATRDVGDGLGGGEAGLHDVRDDLAVGHLLDLSGGGEFAAR